MRALLLAVALAAVLAAPATAAAPKRPHFAWWTAPEASAIVLKSNPQGITYDLQPLKTKLVSARCTGERQGGIVRTGPDLRYPRASPDPSSPHSFFRVFTCSTVYVNLETGKRAVPLMPLHVRTSAARKGRLGCWVWAGSSAALLRRCP